MKIALPDDTNTTRIYLDEEMGDHYDPPGPRVMTDHQRGMKYIRVKKEVGERLLQRGNIRAYRAVTKDKKKKDK